MNQFLDVALRNAARGFRVHPLRGKDAFLRDWPHVATTDEAQIRAWAETFPNYNVGIAAGPDVAILDSDRVSRLKELAGEHAAEWFNTYSVSSGRPDRAHFYYRMTDEVCAFGNKRWKEPEIDGNVFEVKVHGGQVVGEGSVHPDTGNVYRVTQDFPLVPFPAGLMALIRECYAKANPTGKREWNLPVHDGEGRDDFLIHRAGKLRNAGADEDIIRAQLGKWNEDPDVMADPKSEEDLDRIARSAARYDVPGPEPAVTIGSKAEAKILTDWRDAFHTKEETENAPPISFLIENFLQREGVTGLAAPVRERKSLIALNVAHALVTGEELFDHFKVVKQPDRVLYLCPEMALGPFSDRLKKIGLLECVGDRLFYRTLSKDGKLGLIDDVLKPALPGAVVILDTAVRFLKGDEDSSTDMRLFADELFALLRAGAEAVLVLYHSPKNQGNADMMTLENALRGSGDLGAALAACWGTRLQDITKPYESASYLENLKQRDFQSVPFEITSGQDCRLHIVGDPTTRAVTLQPRRGNRANKDGKDEAAEQVIRQNPDMKIHELAQLFTNLGIKRGTTWIGKARARINGTGVTCGEVSAV